MAEPFIVTRILAQSRPSGTSNTALYTKGTKKLAHISHLVICNTTGSAVTYRVFLDADGTTYDETTAIYYDVSIGANTTEFVDIDATIEVDGGSIGIRTSTGSALNFTLMGNVRDII